VSHDRIQWATVFVVFVIAVPAAGVPAPTVVYDNTTTPVSGDWTPGGFWPFSVYATYELMGDQITLAGTHRAITQFDLILSSSEQVTLTTLELIFYINDGIDGYEFPGAPDTELWSDTASDVTVDGTTTVVFSVPNVVVPDTFTWVTSADSMIAGMATYGPPSVGSSGNYFWDRASDDQEWYAMWFESDPVANFGAKVWAVPEPTTMVLLALGGLLAARRRRP